MSEYKERDLIQLDKDGNFYCKHVFAMTREGLRSKSDIAAELGWRDYQTAQLEKEKLELLEVLSDITDIAGDYELALHEEFNSASTYEKSSKITNAEKLLERMK